MFLSGCDKKSCDIHSVYMSADGSNIAISHLYSTLCIEAKYVMDM